MSTRVTLLSAKGTFGHSTSKNVGVDMKDALACVRAGVEDESEFAVRVFERKVLGDGHHFGKKCGISRGEFNHVRIQLGFGNDEEVNRRTWRDVTERDNRVRLEDDVGRDVSGDDGRKYTH